jgi:TolB protein
MVLAAVVGVSAASSPPQKIAYARVFPNAGQIGLFIAAADGTDEHPLLTNGDMDYDPVWAPDGASIVFTSDRQGSADLFRVKPDGSALERLTDDAAYDDQAAFSPDGQQLVFVSSRNGGIAHLWTMNLQTRRVKAVTSGPDGDFRPSWSADGRWIAFSSARGGGLPFAHGRWEHLQLVDLYIVRPDGSSLKRITEHGNFCGSPKWARDNRHVMAYCMTAEQTLGQRYTAGVV